MIKTCYMRFLVFATELHFKSDWLLMCLTFVAKSPGMIKVLVGLKNKDG